MLKNHFPILKRKVNGQPLAYLDNAATTHKPDSVIRAELDFYRKHNANPHRALHALGIEATEIIENVREKLQKFLNADSAEEIVFTKNATEAINLVAGSWGEQNIKKGDEILLTEMEHHANLIPWQQLARRKRARLKFIPVITSGKNSGQLNLRRLNRLISKKTKLLALTHVSNVLGTINPVRQIIKTAKKLNPNITTLVDGAQSVGRMPVDLQRLDCDFFVLTGHKLYGPSGIGALYGRIDLLKKMPPYQTGGSMISRVSLQESDWAEPPTKFEAGTLPIAQIAGLGAALDFLTKASFKKIKKTEDDLTAYALKKLKLIPGLNILGSDSVRSVAKHRAGVIAFTLEGIPGHDLATILNEYGVAVRTGHHCAMPLHEKFKVNSSVRCSFALYNIRAEINTLIRGIKQAQRIFF